MALSSEHQTCACCKLQRKNCDQQCEFAPYFPSTRFKEFQNAHRLFGASNVQKIMASVKPGQKKDTADSLLAEGNARRSDPVHGCYGIIRGLESQLEFAEKELAAVNRHLALYRERVIWKHKRRTQAAGMEQLMILRGRGGGGNGLNNPVRASPVLTISPPPMAYAPVRDDHQQQDHHDRQMLDGVQFPRAIDLNTEAHDGYVYQSTLEEGSALSPFDLQRIDQMVASLQQGNILGSLDEIRDQFSASFKENGKRNIVGKEKVEEAGSSAKGNEFVGN